MYYYTTHLGFQCLFTFILPIEGERSTLIYTFLNVQYFNMSFRLCDYYLTQGLFIEKIVRHFGRFEIIFRFSMRYISNPLQKK